MIHNNRRPKSANRFEVHGPVPTLPITIKYIKYLIQIEELKEAELGAVSGSLVGGDYGFNGSSADSYQVRGVVNRRLSDLRIMDGCAVELSPPTDFESLSPGHSFSLRHEDEEEVVPHLLVGSNDASYLENALTEILGGSEYVQRFGLVFVSTDTDLGKSLLGKRPGDVVELKSGEKVQVGPDIYLSPFFSLEEDFTQSK